MHMVSSRKALTVYFEVSIAYPPLALSRHISCSIIVVQYESAVKQETLFGANIEWESFVESIGSGLNLATYLSSSVEPRGTQKR